MKKRLIPTIYKCDGCGKYYLSHFTIKKGTYPRVCGDKCYEAWEKIVDENWAEFDTHMRVLDDFYRLKKEVTGIDTKPKTDSEMKELQDSANNGIKENSFSLAT